jgi:hypothetical protein
MSFIVADDPGAMWEDPDSPTLEQIAELLAAYIEAKKIIARLEAEIARLNGEQEVVE